MFFKKFFSAVILLLISPVFVSSDYVNAQELDCFSRKEINEKASSILRTVRLEKFGIQVDIPENYRAILLQDGTVQILDPDYVNSKCFYLQTGIGGGMYSQNIRLIKANHSLTPRQQAILASGYNQNDELEPKIIEYNQGSLSGYIVISDFGSIGFIGSIINKKQVLNISIDCDCPVELDELKTLLSRIQPL